ncbi:ATP-dependent RNA helicase DbpA [Methyloversatilis thermotolerans]|uniref:ATP-dependent RNA helicase DbpA n=1 Tax=Methyloversatilis thermotolerans TaxID=1346290 RepID=UPI00037176A7|nr:ATP-dependent RNA helicase DbpA [Methyloversatilis thermotolerans]
MNSASSFDTLPLSAATLANLGALGFNAMTPVQAAALPAALAGRDLIAQARTGSGKTAAFSLPLLQKLNPRWFSPQGLVLCPTRELADQVAREMRKLARGIPNIKILTLCGGAKIGPQIDSLAHGAHVVVGTPGRLLDHIERRTLDLRGISTLVLDEADRMLDMGFFDDIADVVRQCPPARQTLMFSATFPDGVERIAAQFMREAERIAVDTAHAPRAVDEVFIEIDEAARLATAVDLLRRVRPVSTLAFCNTRRRCHDLVQKLGEAGIVAIELVGDMEQRDRDRALLRFAQQSVSVLVATDVAARGLDIAGLDAVVSVDLTPDPEVHVHRIGRTGRGDAAGRAYALVAPFEQVRAQRIADMRGQPLMWQTLDALGSADPAPLQPPMATVQILGGRKEKMRPGDVLGALTAWAGFTREQIGRIDITDYLTFVAVERSIARAVVLKLDGGMVKGRYVKVKVVEE